MKNLKTFALAAFALLGFAACQQEEFAPEIKNPTHSVTFVAGAPESTKTTVDIGDGTDGSAAKFAWTAEDVKRFKLYENSTLAASTQGTLTDGIMTIKAEFDGGVSAGKNNYVAVYNSSNDLQILYKEAYTEDADILVSKAISSFDEKKAVKLQFKREVAIAKMTLKGLDAEEVVNHITVSSTADIAGSYDASGWKETKTSLDIYSAKALDDKATYSIVANEAGEAVVWFTCIPQDATTLTVKVEAADGDTYTKEFGKTITLSQGNVSTFGVAMTKDAPKTYGYQKISSVEEYAPGDYIIVAHAYKDDCPTKGDFAIENTLSISGGKLLGKVVTSIIDNDVIYASDGATYKLSLSGDKDNISISNGTNKLGWDSSTNLKLDKNTTWSLSLNEGDGGTFILLNKATISDTKRTLSFQVYTTSGKIKTESLKFGPYAVSNINDAPYAAIELYKYQEVTPPTPKYSIALADVPGGTLSASPSSAEEGTEVELSATPDAGYEFNNKWTVSNAETSESITVTDGKFTMPAANVSVSGSFSKLDYTITKVANERGSFVAKKGETEVETAQVEDVITLVATPNPGYELISWTVVDSEKAAVEVVDNKFTMPAKAVTVSATFNSSASYTVSFSVNGNVTTKSYKETEEIEFPADPEISGVKFMGWTTSAIRGVQAEAPTFVETSSAVMGAENLTYYAVFATEDNKQITKTFGWETVSDSDWTISSSITRTQANTSYYANSGSYYGLLNSNSTIKFAKKVKATVFSYYCVRRTTNTNTSIKIQTSSDNSNWTDALSTSWNDFNSDSKTYKKIEKTWSGTDDVYVRLNITTAANRQLDDVSISYIEINYSDYCTSVVTLSSVAVSGNPTKTEYTVGEEFDPTGLTVTGTYSNGESAQISDGISWTYTPSTFDASGNQTVSVIATVKSIPSAAYPVNVTVNTITTTLTATDKSIAVNSSLEVSTLFNSDSDGEITYTLVKNTDGAGSLNEGTFSASAAGEYTVEASQAATTKYSAAKATATITVTAGSPGIDATFDYSSLYSTVTTNKTVTSDTVDGVTMTYTKVSGTNAPQYYNNGTNLRIYNKSTITVEAPTGKKLKQIDFSQGTTTWATGKMSADSGEVSDTDKKWSSSSSVSKVVLTITGSFRFTKIVVTYE